MYRKSVGKLPEGILRKNYNPEQNKKKLGVTDQYSYVSPAAGCSIRPLLGLHLHRTGGLLYFNPYGRSKGTWYQITTYFLTYSKV